MQLLYVNLTYKHEHMLKPTHMYTHTHTHRFLNQRGWRNHEIDARIQRIEAGENLEEEEGLYATYAMLHTIRQE